MMSKECVYFGLDSIALSIKAARLNLDWPVNPISFSSSVSLSDYVWMVRSSLWFHLDIQFAMLKQPR